MGNGRQEKVDYLIREWEEEEEDGKKRQEEGRKERTKGEMVERKTN